ncbi:MAG: glycoside hydrolase family 13 protein [Sphaerochaetaceae bacterium]
MWKKSIDSGVNSLYVSNLYPKGGETITLSIKIPPTSPVEEVLLVATIHERQVNSTCERYEDTDIFHISFVMPDSEGLYWCFALRVGRTYYYYSQKGLTRYIPSLHDDFFLRENLQCATWVAGSTCYQIFPDRFRKGDRAVGAHEHEYEFDGGTVSVHGFDEKPLPFGQGRCLDFFNGDLKGIEDSLDYLQSLGIDTLYINPIGMSCTTHRYDCCDFFQIDPKLGGDEAFRSLCSAVHKRGMRILIDISINHTGLNHAWLAKAREDMQSDEHSYYYFKEDGSLLFWQGVSTLPQLNYGSEKLRDIIYQGQDSVLRKFLREPYLQDGWRLDVANEVGRTDTDNYCQEIWQGVRKAVKEENPEAYLVGEDWTDASAHLHGDQWDASMNYFGCSRPLRAWLGERDRYLSYGWGNDPGKSTAYNGYDLVKAIETQLENLDPQMRFLQFNLLSSHDTPRLSAKAHGKDFQLYSGCVMLQYLLPGMPSTYYGDEVGLEGPYGTVEDCRYPMQWDKTKWDRRFVRLYTLMGKIRRNYASLLAFGAYRFMYADNSTVAFVRYDDKQALVALLNKSSKEKAIIIDNSLLGMGQVKNSEAMASFSGTKLLIRLDPRQNCLLELGR